MLTSEFDYNLPDELIAQFPADPRDSSGLMVVDRKKKTIEHRHFFDIVNYFKKGDLLVWNNTKVFKARLFGALEAGVGRAAGKEVFPQRKIEIFLVRPMENLGVWKVLARPAKKLGLGDRVRVAPDFFCDVLFKEKDGTLLVQFHEDDVAVRVKANKYGEVPVPPYVKKTKIDDKQLTSKYQTVYAKREGSVAAPTAGFHFTPELIEKLKNKGVEFAEVTLHVGLGTFLPVKTEKIEDHKMHSEWVELSAKNADLINEAKCSGRRVVAVGTTTVRALEGLASQTTANSLRTTVASKAVDYSLPAGEAGLSVAVHRGSSAVDRSPSAVVQPYTGEIDIFITPGFKFKIVDALITNFHLPKSTLLMLVSAFVGDREFLLQCYDRAVKEKYRFYSFGDGMFII